jgi:hypothetical protein
MLTGLALALVLALLAGGWLRRAGQVLWHATRPAERGGRLARASAGRADAAPQSCTR